MPEVCITLNTEVEHILDGPLCHVCGHPTEKYYDKEYILDGEKVRIRVHNIASYRCPKDFQTYRSHEALFEALTRGAEIMLQHGDETTPDSLRQSIERHREIIESKLPLN